MARNSGTNPDAPVTAAPAANPEAPVVTDPAANPEDSVSADPAANPDATVAAPAALRGPKVKKVKNEAYANMVVTGISGKQIKFGADGVAEVGADDFMQFVACGYEEV